MALASIGFTLHPALEKTALPAHPPHPSPVDICAEMSSAITTLHSDPAGEATQLKREACFMAQPNYRLL